MGIWIQLGGNTDQEQEAPRRNAHEFVAILTEAGNAGTAVATAWEDGPADEADAFRAPRSGTRFSDIHAEDDREQ